MKPDHAGLPFRWETLMKDRLSLLALLFALATGTAFAHGNKVHVRGTVEKISADSVVVKTGDGKSVEVKIAASSVFQSKAKNDDITLNSVLPAAGHAGLIRATPQENIL